MENEEILSEQDIAELGQPILDWEVDEYPQHERSRTWYIVASVVGVSLIVYSIATANFLFAVIILMIGVITLLNTFKTPDKVEVMITTSGIIVSDLFYDYKSIRDFSIVHEPPDVSILYLDFHSSLHPLMSVPLHDIDPNLVRDALIPFVLENFHRDEETLTDLMRRLYKLG
jgi:hypothetical protein